ncbi:Rrf2 family transcriptional regulator [Ligilactobacillus salitolerans]|uniref:Rrf2 family transcriptional regulator n=1 Tax=Ligilactobacillus salitolerans TaxID=1808352 RepID=A0A401IQU3_9LACO|nr:Rrf2 family transcriptional regulator [Ligilactobacillus salitolerans]GBG93883.1 Rrf2 family transcriptional regulator [Ligilactobacillus salitolerans]
MRTSTQLSDALHIMAYIAIFQKNGDLSSTAIAGSVHTNPTNVRKIMGKLKKAGLLKTTNGQAAPALTRSTRLISFYDVACALGEGSLFKVDAQTEPQCIVGGNIQEALSSEYAILQATVAAKMKELTLADVLCQLAWLETNKHPENRTLLAEFLV